MTEEDKAEEEIAIINFLSFSLGVIDNQRARRVALESEPVARFTQESDTVTAVLERLLHLHDVVRLVFKVNPELLKGGDVNRAIILEGILFCQPVVKAARIYFLISSS